MHKRRQKDVDVFRTRSGIFTQFSPAHDRYFPVLRNDPVFNRFLLHRKNFIIFWFATNVLRSRTILVHHDTKIEKYNAEPVQPFAEIPGLYLYTVCMLSRVWYPGDGCIFPPLVRAGGSRNPPSFIAFWKKDELIDADVRNIKRWKISFFAVQWKSWRVFVSRTFYGNWFPVSRIFLCRQRAVVLFPSQVFLSVVLFAVFRFEEICGFYYRLFSYI